MSPVRSNDPDRDADRLPDADANRDGHGDCDDHTDGDPDADADGDQTATPTTTASGTPTETPTPTETATGTPTISPTPIPGVVTQNQFGTLVMTVGKADRLLVPTAKSLIGYPGPLGTPLDHFKCYKVTNTGFRTSGLDIETQFGSLGLDIEKPTHLCVPADKNGEDPAAPSHTESLMCYQVRGGSGWKHSRSSSRTISSP